MVVNRWRPVVARQEREPLAPAQLEVQEPLVRVERELVVPVPLPGSEAAVAQEVAAAAGDSVGSAAPRSPIRTGGGTRCKSGCRQVQWTIRT